MPQRASIAIHLLLAALVLPPLFYYLANDDKRDERFAWRMFSPVRVEKCGTQFFVGDQERAIKLGANFHNAWVGVAQRGRKQVIRAMAQKLCNTNPGQAVRVRILCEEKPQAAAAKPFMLYDPRRADSDEDIEVVSRGLFDFCATGSL